MRFTAEKIFKALIKFKSYKNKENVHKLQGTKINDNMLRDNSACVDTQKQTPTKRFKHPSVANFFSPTCIDSQS